MFFGYMAILFMGIVLGVMGAGGSILTVPILVYLFKMEPVLATTYSLLIVGVTALLGGLSFLKRKEVDIQAGYIFAIPSLVGMYVMRGHVVPAIPELIQWSDSFSISKPVLIMGAFAIIMVTAALSMLRSRSDAPKTKPQLNFIRFSLMAVQGFAVGSVAGFVGAGGGFLIIPALVLLVGLPMRHALGTSLFIIAINSAIGFWSGVRHIAQVDWMFLWGAITIAAIGLFLGLKFSYLIPEKKLKKYFAYFVLIMGFFILIDQIIRLTHTN